MADSAYIIAARLWSKVNVPLHKNAASMCWNWTASTTKGYGQMVVAGKMLRAHRIAYEVAFGPIPDGMHILHKCDNPLCCNPAHLSVGSHDDNMRDKADKGRAWCGGPTRKVH